MTIGASQMRRSGKEVRPQPQGTSRNLCITSVSREDMHSGRGRTRTSAHAAVRATGRGHVDRFFCSAVRQRAQQEMASPQNVNSNTDTSKEHAMLSKTTCGILLGLLGTFMLTALVAAQQSGMSGQMSMETMMKECQTHCQETTASIDQMKTTMEKAQQSNDPAQMREALEQAQKPLTAMKDHMASCMGMMSMMQQMQGGMGGQMKK